MPTNWEDVMSEPEAFRPDLSTTDPSTLARLIGSSLSENEIVALESKMRGVMERADAKSRAVAMLDLVLRAGQFALGRLL